MRTGWWIAASMAAQLMVATSAHAQTTTCNRTEFENAVDEAAAVLRELNSKNTPAFQDKLRALKERRGWTHDQFLAEAVPFVKDDEIAGYDQKIDDFLNRINSMGEAGSTASTPDCKLLAELKGHMSSLVGAMQGKWAYMFQKIDTALAAGKSK